MSGMRDYAAGVHANKIELRAVSRGRTYFLWTKCLWDRFEDFPGLKRRCSPPIAHFDTPEWFEVELGPYLPRSSVAIGATRALKGIGPLRRSECVVSAQPFRLHVGVSRTSTCQCERLAADVWCNASVRTQLTMAHIPRTGNNGDRCHVNNIPPRVTSRACTHHCTHTQCTCTCRAHAGAYPVTSHTDITTWASILLTRLQSRDTHYCSCSVHSRTPSLCDHVCDSFRVTTMQ
jgi:hypothetical protein